MQGMEVSQALEDMDEDVSSVALDGAHLPRAVSVDSPKILQRQFVLICDHACKISCIGEK